MMVFTELRLTNPSATSKPTHTSRPRDRGSYSDPSFHVEAQAVLSFQS